MDEHRIRSEVRSADTQAAADDDFTAARGGATSRNDNYNGAAGSVGALTVAELTDIMHGVLSEMRIYVLESDITDAQNSKKAIVEKSLF